MTPPQSDQPIIEGQSGILLPVRYADAFDGRMGCTIDGAPSSCDLAYSLLGSGAGVQCPNNDCGSRTATYTNLNGETTRFLTGGLGSVSYEYNQLSQLTAETRAFTDSLPNAPSANNSFKLEYTYSLAGHLQSYKDPFGQQINYTQDKVGRLTSVTGSTAFGGITTYASNPQYTAWGGLKGLSYGNQTQMQMTFNNRLQANHYELTRSGQQAPTMSKNYDYYSDGSLKLLSDLVDNRFDRLNTYDNLGRPKTAKSGAEARDGTVSSGDLPTQLPYRQSYGFNAFNNLTQRNNLHWGIDNWNGASNNLSYTYQNNRMVDQYNSRQYDADGRLISSYHEEDEGAYTFNAAGLLTRLLTFEKQDIYRDYDGNGREGKRKILYWFQPPNGAAVWRQRVFAYYIRSSVMDNETITEVNSTGRKVKTFVKAAGAQIAWQKATTNSDGTQQQSVFFEHSDASGLSRRAPDAAGAQMTTEGQDGAHGENQLRGCLQRRYKHQKYVRLSDPVGFSSIVKYRYDTGTNVEAKSPAAGNQYGKETRKNFDSIGRLEKQATWKNILGTNQEYAYRRY